MDMEKLEQMGMKQGFSYVALLDCDTIELIRVINMTSAGAVLRDADLLRTVKQKSVSINMELLSRRLVSWRMLLMARA